MGTTSWFGSIGSAYQRTIDRADVEVKAVLRSIARRRLESQLSDIVRTASSHKANKVAQGDSRYQELYRIADEKVSTFCTKHDVDRSSIEAQVPALLELKGLAQVPVVDETKKPKMFLAGVLGSAIGIVVLGALCHLVQWLFHLGWRI